MSGATYYKATRPDGTDFYTGAVDYAGALASGATITHPDAIIPAYDAAHYLSVSTSPADCTGMSWPCRLFEVEPVGPTCVPDPANLPNKIACCALRVVAEVEAQLALGPQAPHLIDLVERAGKLTVEECEGLAAAENAQRAADAAQAEADATHAAAQAAMVTARRAAADASVLEQTALAAEHDAAAARDAAQKATARALPPQAGQQ